MPVLRERLTLRHFFNQAIFYHMNEPSLLRLDSGEKLKLDEQDSIVLNSTLKSPKTIVELPTKSYVDSLHQSSGKRRDLSSLYIDQDKEFDNIKLANSDSVSVKRDPNADKELAKKCIDDSLAAGTIVRSNQTQENCLKLSVGNDIYHPTTCDKIQITVTTIIKYPYAGGYLLQDWVINCNDKINNGKIQNFIKSTETNSPIGFSGAE